MCTDSCKREADDDIQEGVPPSKKHKSDGDARLDDNFVTSGNTSGYVTSMQGKLKL